jgi:glutathione S-transferase
MTYRLFYWPGLQGRGEFVRLAFEEVAEPYVDVVREDGPEGMAAMAALMGGGEGRPAFAPPILEDGDVVISQTANILLYLGPRLGLAPPDEALRHTAHGLQLTIADFVNEAHDTHHPISGNLFYKDQKEAAKACATEFLNNRAPKYLAYFDKTLAAGDGFAVGGVHSYVDLSLFQVVVGLAYAFPRAMARFDERWPALAALTERVGRRPRLAAYLASPRRIPFNETGIFRHYPELDIDG